MSTCPSPSCPISHLALNSNLRARTSSRTVRSTSASTRTTRSTATVPSTTPTAASTKVCTPHATILFGPPDPTAIFFAHIPPTPAPIPGAWQDDMRSGDGKYTYANGDTYEGEWANNVREGQGTYTHARTGSQVRDHHHHNHHPHTHTHIHIHAHIVCHKLCVCVCCVVSWHVLLCCRVSSQCPNLNPLLCFTV